MDFRFSLVRSRLRIAPVAVVTAGALVALLAASPARAVDPVPATQCGSNPVGTICATPGDGCHIGSCKHPSGGTPFCDPLVQDNPCASTDCAHGCTSTAAPSTGHTCISDGEAHDAAGHGCGDGNACTRNDECDGLGHCVGDTIDCAEDNNWDTQCGTITCLPTGGGCQVDPVGQGANCSDGQDCTYNNGINDVCDGSGHCGSNSLSHWRDTTYPCWSDEEQNSTAGDDGNGHFWCKMGHCGDPDSISHRGKCENVSTATNGSQCGDYGNNCQDRTCTNGVCSAGGTCRSNAFSCGQDNSPCEGVACGSLQYNNQYSCGCDGIFLYP